MVPAVSFTADANLASCHPELDSAANVTSASFLPALDQTRPMWVPAFAVEPL